MGFLRFMLAAAVIWAHAHSDDSIALLGAGVAVTTFFMISGFYMGLVLDTKYGSHTGIFIKSRFLRIYPLYYLTLLLALFLLVSVSLWKGHPVDRLAFYAEAWQAGDVGMLAFLGIIQVTLVGIDLPCILSYSPTTGVHLLSNTLGPDGLLMERLLILPHAWTIGFEMLFYLIIPFLRRFRSRTILAILIASFLLKFYIRWSQGEVQVTKWDQQFFPPQLGFFLAGFLAYRHRNMRLFSPGRLMFLAGLIALAFLYFAWGSLPNLLAQLSWWSVAILLLPKLFAETAVSKFDAWFGALSYPLYLIHIPVRWVMLGSNASYGDAVSPLHLLILSTAAAIIMAMTFEKWLETWRAKFIKKQFQLAEQKSKAS